MEKSKILILHDTFLYKGGWERLILMMWKALKADIASGFFSPGSFDLRKEWFTGKIIPISSEIFAKGFRHIKLKWNFLFSTKFIGTYNTVIFSGDSISAVRSCRTDSKKIYYCHTPPRYIYDLHDLYLWKVKWYLRPVFKIACKVFKFLYERDLKKIDLILTNSENTRARIKKYLWYDSQVLYPPVDTKRFVSLWQKWYFLSFARLADAKRVDKIVEAFTQIADEKLIVIYWKNDPQREKIFKLAQWYSNIELITLEDNDLLYKYIGNARATIYIPIDEDFWMSPVESMSAGKPVLWVDDWWLKETIVHEKTGYLIDSECLIEDIISAVEYLSWERCLSMSSACEHRAWEFGLEAFEKQLQEYMK
jgi:glycosyltransferase involved in cell wall biosynthesis